MCNDAIFFLPFLFIVLIAYIIIIYIIYEKTHNDRLSQKPFNKSKYDNLALSNSNSNFQHDNYNYGKYCQCGESINNGFCSEEQIFSGCFDVRTKNSNFRNLVRKSRDEKFCQKYEDKMINSTKLSDIFDIRANMISSMALGILITLGTAIAYGIIFLLLLYHQCMDKSDCLATIFQTLLGIITIGSQVTSCKFSVIYNCDS